jgi:hypothetical protein
MARLANKTLVNKPTDKNALFGGATEPAIADLRYSGQNGFMTDPKSLVSNANYVKRNVIAVLLESPTGFNDLPNPELLHGTLKALVERHAKSITGLVSTLTVEYVAQTVGGAGEEQEDPSNVTRARSNPSFVWPEKDGMPVQKFIDYWILNLLGDPETKVPRVVQFQDGDVSDLLPDYRGMSVLFFEPDSTHTKVEKCWLTTAMMPRVGGTVEGSRDLQAAGEGLEHTIEFTGVTQVGEGVKQVAQKFLDEMGLTSVNTNLRPAIIEAVSADVGNVDSGNSDMIEEAAKQYV